MGQAPHSRGRDGERCRGALELLGRAVAPAGQGRNMAHACTLAAGSWSRLTLDARTCSHVPSRGHEVAAAGAADLGPSQGLDGGWPRHAVRGPPSGGI